jgi:hypothetical protein
MAWLEYKIALVEPFVKTWEKLPGARFGPDSPTAVMNQGKKSGRDIREESKDATKLMAAAMALSEKGDKEGSLAKTREAIAKGGFDKKVRTHFALCYAEVMAEKLAAKKKDWEAAETK